jgi:hypothetical protein
MSTPFSKPTEQQVAGWYKWALGLSNKQNPFDPSDGGQSWDANNNNGNPIWLAGITATTEPAYRESNISNLKAIVEGSGGKIVYNDGKGKPVQKEKLPQVLPRLIPGSSKNKIDNKNLYIPVSTELATASKYPKMANALSTVARGIIDEEEKGIDPPAFVEFIDAEGNVSSLDGTQVKQGFRIDSSKDISVTVEPEPDVNVFMLPPSKGAEPAAFSDYAVILEGAALKKGENTLKFGLNAKYFSYTVEYRINV